MHYVWRRHGMEYCSAAKRNEPPLVGATAWIQLSYTEDEETKPETYSKSSYIQSHEVQTAGS